ncbi:MAG: NAD(P)-dependent alcohol dehydrogenase [Anaerolineaceae bacterium]|nr:NAD(P)-dependent alcohol dehydrogenase [Anaerolineaceae bacterium]
MKAAVWTKYGSPDGLKLQEVERPAPKDDEILIKIFAAGVTAGDCEMRRLQLPLMLSFPMRLYAGLFKPKNITILGQEFSGEVVAVGKHVRSYQIGEPVFGTTGFRFGAYAELICLSAARREMSGVLAHKPDNLSFEEAAVVPTAGLEALHIMHKANLQPGQKVLIIGAGGSIGSTALQLAKHFGAEVTAVDSPDKLAMLRALGADEVIDYTQEDYTRNAVETYDVIIDVVGKKGVARRLKLLKTGGNYFLAFAWFTHIFLARWVSLTQRKTLNLDAAPQRKEDLLALKQVIEAGKLRPVVDRRFSLAETAAAHRYVESGGKQGNVVLTIGDDQPN